MLCKRGDLPLSLSLVRRGNPRRTTGVKTRGYQSRTVASLPRGYGQGGGRFRGAPLSGVVAAPPLAANPLSR